MRLRWDCLEPAITVPYVPTLGPVHPAAVSEDVFADVLAVAGTGRFLPYDKARLWGGRKDEQVLVDAIVQRPGQTLIPTLARRAGVVRTYAYGDVDRHRAAEMTAKLRANHGAESGRIVWFADTPGYGAAAANRVLLNDLRGEAPAMVDRSVTVLGDEPNATERMFADFAKRADEAGFRHLATRRAAGYDDGSVLIRADGRRIVGAIGPMRSLTDPRGVLALAPQYFAVLPEHRGRGHGRELWRAAMHWGRRHGAAYQLLQAEHGSPAERLYRAEGLTTLGFVHTTPA